MSLSVVKLSAKLRRLFLSGCTNVRVTPSQPVWPPCKTMHFERSTIVGFHFLTPCKMSEYHCALISQWLSIVAFSLPQPGDWKRTEGLWRENGRECLLGTQPSFLQRRRVRGGKRRRERSRGGRAELQLLVPKSPYGLCGRKATLNLNFIQYSELRSVWKSRWPCWAPAPRPCGLCGRKATLNLNFMQYTEFRSCVKVSGGGRPGVPAPNSPRGLVWT